MVYEFLPVSLSNGVYSARNSDRAKILLIPGFLAGDASLYPLAWSLRSLGYRTLFPGFWCNIDCSQRAMQRLSRIVAQLHGRDGCRLVLIGHSLGGIYARGAGASISRTRAVDFPAGSGD